jgi:hypothetical protein
MSEGKECKIGTIKIDLVPCIVCGKSHERRPGPVHEINPLCKTCDDHMNNRPSEQVDTVDFQVKGF